MEQSVADEITTQLPRPWGSVIGVTLLAMSILGLLFYAMHQRDLKLQEDAFSLWADERIRLLQRIEQKISRNNPEGAETIESQLSLEMARDFSLFSQVDNAPAIIVFDQQPGSSNPLFESDVAKEAGLAKLSAALDLNRSHTVIDGDRVTVVRRIESLGWVLLASKNLSHSFFAYWVFGLALVTAMGSALFLFRLFDRYQKRVVTKLSADYQLVCDRRDSLRVVLDATGCGWWEWTPEAGKMVMSDRCRELLYINENGVSNQSVIAMLGGSVHPDDSKKVNHALRGMLENGDVFDEEYRISNDQGNYEWVRARSVATMIDDGHSRHVIGVVTNINEHKLLVQKLSGGKQELTDLLGAMKNPVYQLSAEGKLLSVNAAAAEFFLSKGVTDLVGEELVNLIALIGGKEQANIVQALIDRVLVEGCVETQVSLPIGGGYLYFDLLLRPIYDADGEFNYLLGEANNISQLKEVEHTLRNVQLEMQEFFNALKTFTAKMALDGTMLITNHEVELITGSEVGSFVGQSVLDIPWFADKENQEWMRQAMEKARSGLSSSGFMTVTFIDHQRPIQILVQPVLDEQGDVKFIVAEGADVSELMETEQRLRESEARNQLLLRATGDGFWSMKAGSDEVVFSERYLEQNGALNTASMDVARQGLAEGVYPDDAEILLSAVNGLLSDSQDYDIEYRKLTQDGYQWFSARGAVALDESSQPMMYAGSVRCIDDLKVAEERVRRHNQHLEKTVQERTRLLEASMQRAEAANVAKSEFLANMSHELRTPMHAILSFSRFGTKKIGTVTDEKLKYYFDMINDSGNRLLRLLNDLLDLAKLEAGKMSFDFAKVNLVKCIETSVAEQETRLLDTKLRVEFKPPTFDTVGVFDGDRIGQVVTNLLSNAIKFSPENGTVKIEIEEASLLPEGATVPELALSIKVIDEGIGIPAAELESVFDKFIQSSKTSQGSGGTGLGLSISKEIIDGHGGYIRAEESPLGGACFRFVIPRDTRSWAQKSTPETPVIESSQKNQVA